MLDAAGSPRECHVLGFEAQHLTRYGRFDGGERFGGDGRYRGIGFEPSEVFVDDGDGFVGIEIAAHADGHVVGDIPVGVILLDVGDRGVLEVFLRTQNGLRAVGVGGEEGGEHFFAHFAAVACERHILLFVDGFEFGVEAPDHGIGETVGLYARPVLDLVGGNVLYVDRHVVAGVGVGAFGADGSHQFVVLVWNGYARGDVAYRVDGFVYRRPLGFVGAFAIYLEQAFHFVQHRFFGLIVLCSERGRTLEHQVFEIVRQAGGFGGVVLAPHFHCDVGLQARGLFIYCHVDLQAVGQGVDARSHGVALDGLVLVARAAR